MTGIIIGYAANRFAYFLGALKISLRNKPLNNTGGYIYGGNIMTNNLDNFLIMIKGKQHAK